MSREAHRDRLAKEFSDYSKRKANDAKDFSSPMIIIVMWFMIEQLAELHSELDDIKYRYKMREDLDD